MKQQYKDWITANVTESTYGKCVEITTAMQVAFPELVRVRGHYYCWVWGERAHWWLLDGEEIIDPTKEQFPSCGNGEYVQWVEGTPEPTGSCMNCGGWCYNGQNCCSDNCFRLVCADMGINYGLEAKPDGVSPFEEVKLD